MFVCFFRQNFAVALEPVLELALVDQTDLELTEILLTLPQSAGIKGLSHHGPSPPWGISQGLSASEEVGIKNAEERHGMLSWGAGIEEALCVKYIWAQRRGLSSVDNQEQHSGYHEDVTVSVV